MATYATPADLDLYSEGFTVTDPAAVERELQRAERDVDRLLGYQGQVNAATGLKLDPAALQPYQRDALMRATCAQAEYRIEMGPEFFRRAQHEQVTGPQFTTTGKLPRVGPKVMEELSGSGLVQAWGGLAEGPASPVTRTAPRPRSARYAPLSARRVR